MAQKTSPKKHFNVDCYRRCAFFLLPPPKSAKFLPRRSAVFFQKNMLPLCRWPPCLCPLACVYACVYNMCVCTRVCMHTCMYIHLYICARAMPFALRSRACPLFPLSCCVAIAPVLVSRVTYGFPVCISHSALVCADAPEHHYYYSNIGIILPFLCTYNAFSNVQYPPPP
jgi:hypothetical protein